MSERLPMTLCLVVGAGGQPFAEAMSQLAEAASQVLISDATSGTWVPVTPDSWEARVIALPKTATETEGLNLLGDIASEPWILLLPAEVIPDTSVLPWLRQNLAEVPAGAFRGIFQATDAGYLDRRICLFQQGLQWRSGINGGLQRLDLTDVEAPVVPQLRFRTADETGLSPAEGERAVQTLRQILMDHPHSVRAHFDLADLYGQLGRGTEAYQVLLDAWHSPEVRSKWVNGELPALLSHHAWACGDKAAAVTYARAAIEAEPTHPGAWEVIVRHRFETDGAAAAMQEANGWWTACLSGSPTSCRLLFERPRIFVEALRHVVWAMTAQKRWQDAMVIARLDEAPEDALIHVYIGAGQLETAIERFCRLQPVPDAARTFWHAELARHQEMPELVAGMLWGCLNGDYYRRLALDCFDQVIAEWPESVEGYWRRARVLATRQQDLSQARKDLYRVLRIDPSRHAFWRLLGDVCHHLGDVDGARAAYQESARLLPKKRGLRG